MFKKLVFATALLTSFSSMAGLIKTTAVQSDSYTGTAGDTSLQPGVDPFVFSKFDSSLGTLTNIFVTYSISIDNGYIGADNKTNNAVSGSAELGGQVLFSSDLGFINSSFVSLFQPPLKVTQTVTIELAADLNQTTGGTGPDVQQYNGGPLSDSRNSLQVNSVAFGTFIGSATDTFDVDFETISLNNVSVGGAQGFFEAVDVTVAFEMYYEYEEADEPDVPSVPAPGIFSVGLLCLGALYGRRYIKR